MPHWTDICSSPHAFCRIASAEFKVGMCLVGLFDTKHVWWRTNTGFFTPGLTRKGTFCDEIRSCSQDSFIITNALEDPRFAAHPSVVNRPFARFYAGVPLQSLESHLLGTFAVVDFHVRDPPTPKQITLLKELSNRVVALLQRDVTGRSLSADSSVTLPCIWIDVSTPDWKVMGLNQEWEELTGITSSDFARFPGLFSIMATADDTELEALLEAVATKTEELKAAGTASDLEKSDLQAILCPYDPSGVDLQFVFAIKPATRPPPIPTDAEAINLSTKMPSSLWIAEVHARVRVPAAAPVPLESKRVSSEMYVPVSSSGGKSPLNNINHSSSALRSGGTASTGSGGGLGNMDSLGSRASSDRLNIPARLSSLQLGQLLGKGSYGSVYAGVLKGRSVAVKIIESISGPEQEAQQWEAQFEALLGIARQHENIVHTTDWIKEDSTGQTWIVQDLCDLGTMASLYKDKILMDMATNKPDMLSVLETALEIARGMEYLHSSSALHRDLCSNNVLLCSADKDGRGFTAKVTDFGLARISDRTITTKTVGTVSHMPPELLVDGIMSKAGDVYSFGVVLWEMWNGKRAWEGATMGQVVFAVTVKDQRLTLDEDAPSELAALVKDCAQTDRQLRPTFTEIVNRLEKMKSDWLAENPHIVKNAVETE
jgi:serine/threonine protein kinase